MKNTSLHLATSVLVFSLLAAAQAAAEQAYITDKVVVDVHSLQNEEGLVIGSLNSGSQVEVLVIDGKYAQIKLPDNQTGWLNTKYISNEKPVTAEYLALQEKYNTTAHELEMAQIRLGRVEELEKVSRNAGVANDELEKSKKQIEQLRKDLSGKDKQLAEAQQAVTALKQKIASQSAAADSPIQETGGLETETQANNPPGADVDNELLAGSDLAPPSFSVPFLWAFIAMLFTASVGFLLGMKWLDQRIRKRHGGVKLY